MEEKNITNQTNEVKQTKPAPQAKKAKATKKGNDKDTFADYKAEFKKIVWPDRPEVVKKTATVVVTSLIIKMWFPSTMRKRFLFTGGRFARAESTCGDENRSRGID